MFAFTTPEGDIVLVNGDHITCVTDRGRHRRIHLSDGDFVRVVESVGSISDQINDDG